MERKVTSLTDIVQVVERDSEEMSNYLVEELVGLVQQVKKQEKANNRSVATYWFYRVPFPGVRYYSYE
jgi:hypothetical protein